LVKRLDSGLIRATNLCISGKIKVLKHAGITEMSGNVVKKSNPKNKTNQRFPIRIYFMKNIYR